MNLNSRLSDNYSRAFLTILFVFVFSGLSLAQQVQRYEYSSRHMGTLFRVVLYAPSDSIARTAATAAFNRIDTLNSILSDYISKSELSRLSRFSGKDTAVYVSSPLFQVLHKAREVSMETDGAFDITVGPYVQLWRSMQKESDPRLPTPRELKKAGQKVGYRHLRLNQHNQTVRLTKAGMQLDLGGIAKGYALDEALLVLQKYGIEAALIDGGGDIAVGKAPLGKRGWSIEVQTYPEAGSTERLTLVLANKAVATSGDLYQHIEIDGTRYSHIIDPRTGLGLTEQSQVTVVAPDGITADSYASALSVLDPQKGLQLIESLPGLAACIVRLKNSSINRWETDSFKKLTKKLPDDK